MAQLIPQEIIETVRQQTNIVDVIGQYVQLKKSGKNYMGLCPFHEERSPSFSVAEDKQIFHCFGCGKGGTVFTFLQEIDGLSFPEAVQKTAELARVPLTFDWQKATTQSHVNQTNQQLFSLYKQAADVYHHVLLNTQIGAAALAYLTERGVSKEMIQTFQLGFAPDKRDFLLQVLQKETPAVLADSGLFVQRENGDLLDRFYQRILFPIRDAKGQVIAFSGRLLETETFSKKEFPKYLNSPETVIFNKSDVLFNFDLARKEIRKQNAVFLYEGFMDVIAAYQVGMQNGVASMGTSLTHEHVQQLSRVAKELTLCYDGDQAGLKATERALALLERSPLQLSVVHLPEKLDPDEYVKKYGAEAFKNLLLHGKKTIFQFKMTLYQQDRNMNNEKERLEYVRLLLNELMNIPSPLEKDQYLTQLAELTQMPKQSLLEELKQLSQQTNARRKKQNHSVAPVSAQPSHTSTLQQNKLPLTQIEKAEELLLYRLMHEVSVRLFLKQQAAFAFAHEPYQLLYFALEDYFQQTTAFDLVHFLDHVKEESLRQLAISIAYKELSAESSEKEIQDLLQMIQTAEITNQITEMRRKLQEAKNAKNTLLEERFAAELVNLLQKKQKNQTFH